eukprot:gb/GECG01011684.1/.p1 GENE.gb/GECG01011684.1/~~gb/GECG01011684.1/.p1  ORF type:complete len:638 (+),score=64.22 gb/GECG01011684.1/:1-1914(+)
MSTANREGTNGVHSSTSTTETNQHARADRLIDNSSRKKLALLCKRLANSMDADKLREVLDSLCERETKDDTDEDMKSAQKNSKKRGREFDYSRYRYRHVALQVMYLGEKYIGLAAQTEQYGSGQEDSSSCMKSVESHLFKALHTTKLLPNDSRDDAKYQRCGRTDRGVSANWQILSLRLRSKAKATTVREDGRADPLAAGEDFPSPESELDYVGMLNKILPEDIRVGGWCDAGTQFSARHSASYRVYRYYFVKRGLDIEQMRTAAKKLEGTHDFRNFCKPDVANVKSFSRKLISCDIHPLNSIARASSSVTDELKSFDHLSYLQTRHQVYFVEVVGCAFLWHQVRCMVAVLFLVGKHLESPEIVDRLLNPLEFPGKPSYHLASERPLLLYYCHFHSLPLWCPSKSLQRLTQSLEKQWADSAIRMSMISDMLQSLYNRPVPLRKDSDNGEHVVCKPKWIQADSIEKLVCNYESASSTTIDDTETSRDLCPVGAVDNRIPDLHVPRKFLPGTASYASFLEERYRRRSSKLLADTGTLVLPDTRPSTDTPREVPQDSVECLPCTDPNVSNYWSWGELICSAVASSNARVCEQLQHVVGIRDAPDEHLEHILGYRSRDKYHPLETRKQEPSIEERLKKQKR